MTNNRAPETAYPAAPGPRNADDLDLSPQGLADAPAAQADPDSLVYTGNS